MYSLTIKVPVYNAVVHVRFDTQITKLVNKFAKRKKWKEVQIKEGMEVHGLAVTADDCINYYIFYDLESTTVNIIAHEISHTIDNIFEEKEIELSGEARAYLTGHISEQIFDYVLKKGILLNKYIPKKIEKPIIINTQEDEKPSKLL